MYLDEVREFCLSLPGAEESLPFDESTLAFKVGNKIFAITDIDEYDFVNVKCDPEKAIELREMYPGEVIPGYHMNKKHWNSLVMDAGLPPDKVKEWISDSYELVRAGLPKKIREALPKK